MDKWIDISSAPKAVWIVGYGPNIRPTGGELPFVVCSWARDIQSFADEEGYPVYPTHWLPLPTPPETKA